MRTILIIIGLIITLGVNAQVGFTSWVEPEVPPTTQELLQSLSGGQRSGILDGFSDRKSVGAIHHQYFIETRVVKYFYQLLADFNSQADQLMMDYDLNYNSLLDSMVVRFTTDFNAVQTEAILTKKIEMADGIDDGETTVADWTFYKEQF